MSKGHRTENGDLIPVTILRVNLSHCEDCPQKLRDALLKKNGVYGVDFDSEYELVTIRSTLDPIMLIKAIAKMNKHAELVYYDKLPMLEEEDEEGQHKNAKSSDKKNPPTGEPNKQNSRPDGKEKGERCPGFRDTRKKEEDDLEDDNDCQRRNGRKGCGSSANRRDSFKKEDDHHEADDHHHRTRNARENAKGQGKFSDRRKNVPDNAEENGSEEYRPCRNSDAHHKPSEGNNRSRNAREKNAKGKNHHCRNYDEPWENVREKDQKQFPHCRNFADNARENGSEEYPRCRNYEPLHRRGEDKKIPKMFSDEDADIFKNKEYTTGRSTQFRSRSDRYDARNPEDWYDSPEAFPYQHQQSRMPPYYSEPPQMPPYYSNFSQDNTNGCSIM
ncbi:OLC1v1003047C1 [Oldenlandia corymbosa var. corymbosa]|nr:OLC1v1003047C1 [Oldenlandia corymbosa var. corymbosa]